MLVGGTNINILPGCVNRSSQDYGNLCSFARRTLPTHKSGCLARSGL